VLDSLDARTQGIALDIAGKATKAAVLLHKNAAKTPLPKRAAATITLMMPEAESA
jgi:hypothetical protein